LSTINPTWIDPDANPALRGERPATNRLSHGTALIRDVSARRNDNTAGGCYYYWLSLRSVECHHTNNKRWHLKHKEHARCSEHNGGRSWKQTNSCRW
jgi:hypothetical protein